MTIILLKENEYHADFLGKHQALLGSLQTGLAEPALLLAKRISGEPTNKKPDIWAALLLQKKLFASCKN